MPPDTLHQLNEGVGKTGVGIAGMRERVRELGGYMVIQSDSRGTLLMVILPLAYPSESSPEKGEYRNKITAA
jgi:glucose-6-phosphate-specific signal transduction histidine kinase